jgi:hypothetical protein
MGHDRPVLRTEIPAPPETCPFLLVTPVLRGLLAENGVAPLWEYGVKDGRWKKGPLAGVFG